MKIRILTISKGEEPNTERLFSKYVKRTSHYSSIEIVSIKSSSKNDEHDLLKEESELVLKKLKAGEELILLDSVGKEFSSSEFSLWLQKKMNASLNLCFVIGGAYGFHPDLKKKAFSMISLSKMTLPHQLAKVVFAEQLYRAFTILRNEKYHH